MIRAIIVDDEDHCVRRMEYLLKEYCAGEIEVVAFCNDVDSAFESIEANQPDVVFLDVHLHQATGFDLLEKFSEIRFDIVFTTAHQQYAVQAFRFAALNYLLKPIDPDDLVKTIKRIKNSPRIRPEKDVYADAAKTIEKEELPKHIRIVTTTDHVVVPVTDIIRMESEVNYTRIFIKGREKAITSAKTLKSYKELLNPYDMFFRVHNSHVLNLNFVKGYSKDKDSLVLSNGMEIPVSTRRKKDTLVRLSEIKKTYSTL